MKTEIDNRPSAVFHRAVQRFIRLRLAELLNCWVEEHDPGPGMRAAKATGDWILGTREYLQWHEIEPLVKLTTRYIKAEARDRVDPPVTISWGKHPKLTFSVEAEDCSSIVEFDPIPMKEIFVYQFDHGEGTREEFANFRRGLNDALDAAEKQIEKHGQFAETRE